MGRVMLLFLLLLLLIPLGFSISIKELIKRYSFSAATTQMNITNSTDFMADKNGNGLNDTLVIELTISSTNGYYIFIINLFDGGNILANETNKTLGSGINKLNISFNSIFLSKNHFNYSIKVYNSTYSLKFRKDNLSTRIYNNYEQGFSIVNVSDSRINKALRVNVALNSTINGTFEAVLYLSYNSSLIFLKKSFTLSDSLNNLAFDFQNETIKRTHYAGSFNVSSLKISRKIMKTGYATALYDFKDFASESYIFNFTDNGIDTNNNAKHDFLQVNASVQIPEENNYTIILALYDLFGNLLETKNSSYIFGIGKNTAAIGINGSRIFDKKLNGPFIIKYIELHKNNTLVDNMNDAHTTNYYSYSDFENPNLPDLQVNISISDNYLYGIGNVTINVTIKNSGNSNAFNVFAEIFDNKTFFRTNVSNILKQGSQVLYQFNFTNISDFDITAITDLQNFVEESNESNNAQKLAIKLNYAPSLLQVSNVIVNETDKITINLSASDANNDNLSFYINNSNFVNRSNIFEWHTTTLDSGNYTLKAIASDGYLNDSRIFNVAILDTPEKDIDNDGINDSVDKLIGNEKSVNTSTINLTILIDESSNLSRIFNESTRIKFVDKNFTIAEFDFNFSQSRLNLTNITVNKQGQNETGSLIVKGLKMPEGIKKALYLDKINVTLNGICIKDAEIFSLGEISSNCASANEFKIECDGTAQFSYVCAYNSTSNKYRVQELKHSGIMQIAYTKPAEQTSQASSQSAASSGGGGGGGRGFCVSKWECSEWSECVKGIRSRKCYDANKCAFPAKMPSEVEDCVERKTEAAPIESEIIKNKEFEQNIATSKKFQSITGQAIALMPKTKNLYALDAVSILIVIMLLYISIRSIYLGNI